MRNRKKYNLLFAIKDMKLEVAFHEYCERLNPNISDNRKARAFLTRYSRIIGPWQLPCYEYGHETPSDEYYGIISDEIIDIIRNTSWLN